MAEYGQFRLKTPVRFRANADSISAPAAMEASMPGEKRAAQGRLFYEFDLEAMVPQDHLLRKIDAVLDLSSLRAELAPHYSHTGIVALAIGSGANSRTSDVPSRGVAQAARPVNRTEPRARDADLIRCSTLIRCIGPGPQ